MTLSNFKIKTKISAGFSIILALALVQGLLSLSQLGNVASTTEGIATDNMPSVQLTGELRDLLNEVRRTEARHLLSSARKEMKSLEARMAEDRKKINALDARADVMFKSDLEKKAMQSFRQQRDLWYGAGEKMAPASRAGKQDEASDIYNGESNTAFDAAMAEVVNLSEFNSQEATRAWEKAQKVNRNARWMVELSIAVTFFLAVVLAVTIARSISRPIALAVHSADVIADGDMTEALHPVGTDETARLLRALEKMRSNLAKVVTEVRNGSESVATASDEIARGNMDLSERTEEQASALHETSASMEELSATIHKNTQSSSHANQLALNASAVAIKGGDVVSQVVETMKGINESSGKISDIISVIDGIAFQTNILALNAAVEAARAGEQGRGFAVVAAEVRLLASRSAQAAKEIKVLINTSVERVAQGNTLVAEAGSTMAGVVSAIQEVADIMGEIITASNEQAVGVASVGEAVVLMDQATQQNAALVEQMAASAASLKEQAFELVETVAVFKLSA